ncbi:hypothetical protein J2S21_004558 [Peribacillus cavernae]|nr:hypothetical protein [Peribacillus cavernae]
MEEFNKLLIENHIKLSTRWFLPDVSDPKFDPTIHKTKLH